MSNSVIIWVVGAVIILGGGYFLYTSMSGSGDSMMEEGSMEGSANGTFASLMASGQSLECTFEHRDGTNTSSGTVYMTGRAAQLRGDFTMQQGGQNMEAHVIRTDGYSYVWGSFSPQGIKTRITAENEGKLFDDDGGAIDENTSFDCKQWRVDNSKFSLPAGVEFADISMQMEAATGAMEGMKAQQCAACNQLPAGSGREQCLAALSC